MDSILSNEFIKELLLCNKKICLPPSPKKKSNGQHKETGIEVESTDGKYKFSVFIREHTELLEFFSVGLTFWPDGSSSIIIARYNGNHGKHRNILTKEILQGGCHIHQYREDVVKAGINCDNYAELTDKYSTVSQATRVFFEDLKIINFTDYFPELLQNELFK